MLWDIIASSKKSHIGAQPDQGMVVHTVCSKMNIQECAEIVSKIKDHMQKQKGKSSSQRKSVPGVENVIVFDSDDYREYGDEDVEMRDERPSIPPRTSYKSFLELSKYRQRCRTDSIVNELKNFIENEELIEKEGTPLSITQLLGYLLYRVNYNTNKTMAQVGAQIYRNQFSPAAFDVSDAISLKHNMTLSKEDMRMMKRYMNEKGVSFPNTNQLLKERLKLRPPISPVLELDSQGVFVDYIKLVQMTTASVIDAANYSLDSPLDPSLKYKMTYKDGADGSGCQTIWKSKSMIDAVPNMFQHSIVPLQLEFFNEVGVKSVVWKNPSPNNSTWCRPVFLVRMVEGEAAKHVVPYTDQCRAKLEEESVVVRAPRCEISYDVMHGIKDTMKDLKYKKSICGLQGADCILCKHKKADWMKEDRIREGFNITRTAEETMKLFIRLISNNDDDDLTVPRAKNDYDEREGLTQPPLTTSDQHSICITHAYINVTEWFVKVLARLNAEYLHWVKKSTVYGDHIRAGESRVKKIIENGIGLRVSQVQDATAKTGGSTDGNTGRTFFKQKSLPTILACVEPKYYDDLLKLHKNISSALRIISSSGRVMLDNFKTLLLDTSLHIAQKFPWVEINYTLHGVLHHSYDHIIQNHGYSLGALSEEALESTNKFIRRYAELFSRKTSPLDQITDVMTRLLEKSNPYIVQRRMNYRPRKRSCVECGSTKHSTKQHDEHIQDSYEEVVDNILVLDEDC